MRQRVHLISLGVEDLERASAFYDALGWQRATDCPPGLVAYDLYGATLGLYPKAELAKDMGLTGLPAGSGAVTLSNNVREKSEVAAIVALARAAGAEVLKEPRDVFWGGHIAYIRDPDGHIWEIAHNPFSPPADDGAFQWGG